MSAGNHNNYFVHTLLRARDWQHRPQLDQVCDWWRDGKVVFRSAKERTFAERKATIGRGVCALVGMGGAGKTAIADRFLNDVLDIRSRSRKTSDDHGKDPNSHESGYDALRCWSESVCSVWGSIAKPSPPSSPVQPPKMSPGTHSPAARRSKLLR